MVNFKENYHLKGSRRVQQLSVGAQLHRFYIGRNVMGRIVHLLPRGAVGAL